MILLKEPFRFQRSKQQKDIADHEMARVPGEGERYQNGGMVWVHEERYKQKRERELQRKRLAEQRKKLAEEREKLAEHREREREKYDAEYIDNGYRVKSKKANDQEMENRRLTLENENLRAMLAKYQDHHKKCVRGHGVMDVKKEEHKSHLTQPPPAAHLSEGQGRARYQE